MSQLRNFDERASRWGRALALVLVAALLVAIPGSAQQGDFSYHLEAESLVLEKGENSISARAEGSVVLTSTRGEKFNAASMEAELESVYLSDPPSVESARQGSPFGETGSRVIEIRMNGPLTYRYRGLEARAGRATSSSPDARWRIGGGISVNYSSGGRSLRADGSGGVLNIAGRRINIDSPDGEIGLEEGRLSVSGSRIDFPMSLNRFVLSDGRMVYRGDERVTLRAPDLIYSVPAGEFTAEGGVSLNLREFRIAARTVSLWTGRKKAVAAGSVQVTGPEGSTDAERAEIDFSGEEIQISLQGQKQTEIEL